MSTYRLRINGALPGGLLWSTGYTILSTAAASSVASTLDSAWNTLWTDATNGLGKFVHTDVTTINTVVYTLNTSLITTAKNTTPRALAGTDANPTMDLASSPYIAFTGAQDTKSDKGRMKLPPLASDVIAAGLVTNACVTSLTTVFNAFFTTMKGLAGYQAVSFNRHVNKQGDPANTPHQLTGGLLVNRLGSERPRKRKLKTTFSGAITL